MMEEAVEARREATPKATGTVDTRAAPASARGRLQTSQMRQMCNQIHSWYFTVILQSVVQYTEAIENN